MEYDAWGRILSDSNPGFQPFAFAGRLHDRRTSLVNFGARDYMPRIARFTSKDPARFIAGDTNLYAYAEGDPVNNTDAGGLVAVSSLSKDFGRKALSRIVDQFLRGEDLRLNTSKGLPGGRFQRISNGRFVNSRFGFGKALKGAFRQIGIAKRFFGLGKFLGEKGAEFAFDQEPFRDLICRLDPSTCFEPPEPSKPPTPEPEAPATGGSCPGPEGPAEPDPLTGLEPFFGV